MTFTHENSEEHEAADRGDDAECPPADKIAQPLTRECDNEAPRAQRGHEAAPCADDGGSGTSLDYWHVGILSCDQIAGAAGRCPGMKPGGGPYCCTHRKQNEGTPLTNRASRRGSGPGRSPRA